MASVVWPSGASFRARSQDPGHWKRGYGIFGGFLTVCRQLYCDSVTVELFLRTDHEHVVGTMPFCHGPEIVTVC